jgi:hypothetical protein
MIWPSARSQHSLPTGARPAGDGLFTWYCHRPSGSPRTSGCLGRPAPASPSRSPRRPPGSPLQRESYRVGPKVAQDFDCKSLCAASSWPNFWANPVTFTLARTGHYYAHASAELISSYQPQGGTILVRRLGTRCAWSARLRLRAGQRAPPAVPSSASQTRRRFSWSGCWRVSVVSTHVACARGRARRLSLAAVDTAVFVLRNETATTHRARAMQGKIHRVDPNPKIRKLTQQFD